MYEKLFPKTIDYQYDGMAIAKWVFVAMTVLTVDHAGAFTQR